jgi:hypothetical protein
MPALRASAAVNRVPGGSSTTLTPSEWAKETLSSLEPEST